MKVFYILLFLSFSVFSEEKCGNYAIFDKEHNGGECRCELGYAYSNEKDNFNCYKVDCATSFYDEKGDAVIALEEYGVYDSIKDRYLCKDGFFHDKAEVIIKSSGYRSLAAECV